MMIVVSFDSFSVWVKFVIVCIEIEDWMWNVFKFSGDYIDLFNCLF